MYGFWYLMRRLRPAEAASEIRTLSSGGSAQRPGTLFPGLVPARGAPGFRCRRGGAQDHGTNAHYWPGHFVLGLHYALEGMHTEALRATERSYSLLHRNVPTAGLLAALLMEAGDADRANEVLQKLGPAESYGSPVGWATFHLVRGEFEKAAEWIEKGVEQRHPVPLPLAMLDERWWRGLRSSSRWPGIASKMNLPETM